MFSARFKWVIRLGATALLIGSWALLAYVCLAPLRLATPMASRRSVPAAASTAHMPAQGDLPAESQWESLFARRFQAPLFDPPPPPPPPVVDTTVPPPPIVVVATIVEPNGGSAMIQDETGNVVVTQVGEEIRAGGTTAKLVQVYPDRIEIEHAGKVITVSLKMN
jgi:hypothetical protein